MYLTPNGFSPNNCVRPLPNRERDTAETLLAPGTCGEFVQGYLNGIDFLINSPIDRYAKATTYSTGEPGISVRDGHLFPKTVAVVTEVEQRYAVPGGFEIVLQSSIPQCKGMASSTADLVAAIGAIEARCGLTIPATELAGILSDIEPSDCTHVPGVALVGHVCGRIFGRFQAPSSLRVLIVDGGDDVVTMEFDRDRARHIYARTETPLRAALNMARRGLITDDPVILANAATISARLSQEILPKPHFHELLAVAGEQNALGINCAHSGSVLGVLYDPEKTNGGRLRRAVEQALGNDIGIIGDHRFISGGVHVR